VSAEEHAVGGKRVEIGRANNGMIELRKTVAAPLIGSDEQQIERR
jgi:hypothetical protein